jgi:hypothetical protein
VTISLCRPCSTLFDSRQFRTVCSRIPSNRVAMIDEAGILKLAPEKWLRQRFWEDYFNHLPSAVEEFNDEKVKTIDESAERRFSPRLSRQLVRWRTHKESGFTIFAGSDRDRLKQSANRLRSTLRSQLSSLTDSRDPIELKLPLVPRPHSVSHRTKPRGRIVGASD